jgi:hypothetical protein
MYTLFLVIHIKLWILVIRCMFFRQIVQFLVLILLGSANTQKNFSFFVVVVVVEKFTTNRVGQWFLTSSEWVSEWVIYFLCSHLKFWPKQTFKFRFQLGHCFEPCPAPSSLNRSTNSLSFVESYAFCIATGVPSRTSQLTSPTLKVLGKQMSLFHIGFFLWLWVHELVSVYLSCLCTTFVCWGLLFPKHVHW